MFKRRSFDFIFSISSLSLLGTLALAVSANAQLMLTSNATTAGFGLSTFAFNFPTISLPSGSLGPVGITFNNGRVLVAGVPGSVYVFANNTDGKNAVTDTLFTRNYGSADGLATSNGHIYLTQQVNGKLIEINSDGTFNQNILTATTAEGLAVNASNGHLFLSTLNSNQILDVDPIAKTSTLFANTFADGLTTDGSNLYAAVGNAVLGYRISDKSIIYNSGVINGGPDGVAVGTGSLAGNLFVNTNNGNVIEINIATNVRTLIAQNGSRGDFVTVDPNGTLLLTQSDRILRLTAPTGGAFGPSVPEPGLIALLSGIGVCGAGFLLRSRKRS